MHILAAAEPSLPAPESASSVGWVVIILGGLLVTAYYASELFKLWVGKKETTRMSLGDQPVEVREAHRFTTREEHQELKVRVDSMVEKIEEGFRHIDQKRSVSIAGVHELVRDQGVKIASLQAETTSQSGSLDDLKDAVDGINSRIDSIPSRFIELLRNTKGLL